MIKKILTADNTETYLNEEVGESYHSQTGAVEEAFKKYAIPCKIKELAKKGKIRILDICSGIMYNSSSAIDAAWEENPNCQIEISALENDFEIIKKIKEINPPIKSYKLIQEMKIEDKKELKYENHNLKITILVGDARECIKKLKDNYFDAVFMDPFSPKTSPEMWSTDFFKEIHRVIKDKRILATYTCARLARDNIKAAGFMYEDGPIVGRRGPGTIAFKWEF